jgi:trimeric autotransporter adhesin
MRGLLALFILGAFALAGGVSADTGALPAPQQTDGFSYTWPGAASLQVTPSPWGGGSIQSTPGYFVDCPFACIRPFDAGAVVTLKQTPTPGFTFLGWQVANHGQPATAGVCPGDGNCTVTMDQAKDVVAVYLAPPANHHGSDFGGGGGGGGGGEKFPVTVSLTGPGSGTVTSDPAGISCSGDARAGCSASFTAGSTVKLTADANPGSSFEVWEGDCSGSPSEVCTLTMDGPKSATVDFESS